MPTDSKDRSFLNPDAHPERWARVVAGIHAAAEPELQRRARALRPASLLQRWSRPTAAVAATIAAAAITVLLISPWSRPTSGQPDGTRGDIGVAHAIGLPDPFVSWIEAGEAPAIEEMLNSFPAR
jgi:hypothetical protein